MPNSSDETRVARAPGSGRSSPLRPLERNDGQSDMIVENPAANSSPSPAAPDTYRIVRS